MRAMILDETGGVFIDVVESGKIGERVGGWIDVVPLRSADTDDVGWQSVDVFVDDEGKIKQRPTNAYATALAHHFGSIFSDDRIAGTVVILGEPDDDGETTDLPFEFIRFAVEFIAEHSIGRAPTPVRVAPTFWENAAEIVAAGVPLIVGAAPDEFPEPVVEP